MVKALDGEPCSFGDVGSSFRDAAPKAELGTAELKNRAAN